MIPDERASRFGEHYLEEGKRVVTFNPKLTEEEWKYLMFCQEIAAAVKREETEAMEKKLIEKAEKEKAKRDKAQADKKKKEEEELAKIKAKNEGTEE